MLPKNTGLVHLPALMSSISRCIYVIRGHKVMLDVDLAELYGVTTKRLNEQVKRNRKRFPTDFMFRLTVNEAETVISLRSQIATLKRGRHRKYLPYVFTEQGVAMLSSVLHSNRSIAVNIVIMRAFVKLRELSARSQELVRQLSEMGKKYDARFRQVFRAIRQLMEPVPESVPPRRGIGFTADHRPPPQRSQFATLKIHRPATGADGCATIEFSMKVALGQINTTVGDLAGNVARMVRASFDAAKGGAEIVVFPELSITGYPPRDLVEKPTFIERSEQHLERLAAETAALDLSVICGYVGRAHSPAGKSATNSAAILQKGNIVFRQSKMLLPTYDVFDEARYFMPAENQKLTRIEDTAVALTICEDAWNDKQFWERRLYRRDPVDELISAGGKLLISINASPYHMGKRTLRHEIFTAAARHHCIPLVYVNQVGGNDSLVFDGTSFAMNAEGSVIASAASFQEDLVFVDMSSGEGDQHQGIHDECEAAYEALVVGTRDYIRKCGFERVLVGLSGGIDSSLTAVIAADAVGRQNVVGVGMPGPYSSSGSVNDALALAANLGIRFEVASITPMYAEFLKALDPLFAGAPRDVTEENLQARLRGVTLMALSNKWGALVLTTGNKSELAVGYCTLYGDMCGGLAVISDVPKTLVYSLSRVANKRHPGAIPEAVFEKPPSAELRPDQKDTDSLPPYEVLDPILRGYVEDDLSPRQISEQLGQPLDLVKRIINQVDRNEYKRQQAAPGIKVTSKAFGIGRRFPVAQKYVE